MVNETYVIVTNWPDLVQLEHNTTLTNYLLIFIIFSFYCLLFFRNVGRINNNKKGKR